MKLFFSAVLFLFIILGCREDVVQFSIEQSTADVIIKSNPNNAQIFLDNSFSGKFTPDTLINLEPGSYLLTLKLDGFRDSSTTIVVEPQNDQSLFIRMNSQ